MNNFHYSSYNDFYNKVIHLTNSEKGDQFEYLTKFLFLIHPNFINITKHIYLYSEIPYDIKGKFQLPNIDKGIDLLLVTYDNKYYPIQCKFRTDIEDIIPWTDLSTFAGQLFVGNFQKGILVTNTFEICDEIKKSDKIDVINGDFFDNLIDDFFTNVQNYIHNIPIYYQHKNTRYYQDRIINSTIKYFQSNDRGYISMACGTGKTFTVFNIDKNMNNSKTLILVPSLYLLSQIYSEFAIDLIDTDTKFILIGSDSEHKDVFLSTDRNSILEQLVTDSKIIVISTYQSCELLNNIDIVFDLIIFDEAHKTVSEGKQFTNALYNNNIKSNKRLFVTATPKITGDEDDEISMDNVAIYGDCIDTYQIGEAIDDGYLCPYEIHAMYVSNKDIVEFKDRNVLVDDTIYNFHFIACLLMLQDKLKTTLNHLLTYHSSINSSKMFTKLLKNNCDLSSRERIKSHLRNKIELNSTNLDDYYL